MQQFLFFCFLNLLTVIMQLSGCLSICQSLCSREQFSFSWEADSSFPLEQQKDAICILLLLQAGEGKGLPPTCSKSWRGT